MKNFGAERLSMQLPKENPMNITIDVVLGGGAIFSFHQGF